MAQKTVVTLIDDLDQGEADETVEFGLDGVTYEIDLSDRNAAKLRDGLADYLAAARRVAGRKQTGKKAATGTLFTGAPAATSTKKAPIDREQSRAIREWAQKNGATELANRGRIPAEVEQAYQANDPAAIPDRYKAVDAGEVSERAVAAVSTEPVEEPLTLDGAAEDAAEGQDDPSSWGDSPRNLSIDQKRAVAAWAKEEGIIDTAAPNKVNSDMIASYKSVQARKEAQPA